MTHGQRPEPFASLEDAIAEIERLQARVAQLEADLDRVSPAVAPAAREAVAGGAPPASTPAIGATSPAATSARPPIMDVLTGDDEVANRHLQDLRGTIARLRQERAQASAEFLNLTGRLSPQDSAAAVPPVPPPPGPLETEPATDEPIPWELPDEAQMRIAASRTVALAPSEGGEWPRAAAGESVVDLPTFGTREPAPRVGRRAATAALAGAVLLAALGGTWAVKQWQDRTASPGPAPANRPAPSSTTAGRAPAGTPPASPGPETTPGAGAAATSASRTELPSRSTGAAAPGRGAHVEITTTREVWLRVVVDDQERAADLFAPGRSLAFDGEGSLLIRAGDAGAVRVTIDGRALGSLGRDGAVLTRRFELGGAAAR